MTPKYVIKMCELRWEGDKAVYTPNPLGMHSVAFKIDEPSFTELLEELWDECSSFVDSDIDSLQSVAGTTVLTRSQFATLIEKFEKRFKK